jgi:hypothetical protein
MSWGVAIWRLDRKGLAPGKGGLARSGNNGLRLRGGDEVHK